MDFMVDGNMRYTEQTVNFLSKLFFLNTAVISMLAIFVHTCTCINFPQNYRPGIFPDSLVKQSKVFISNQGVNCRVHIQISS